MSDSEHIFRVEYQNFTDAAIAEFWPEMDTVEGRAEIRRQYAALMEHHFHTTVDALIRRQRCAMRAAVEVNIIDCPSCQSCGAPVQHDTWLPDDLFAQVSGDGGNGMFCPTCLVARCVDVLGWPAVRLSNSHATADAVAEAARVVLAEIWREYLDGRPETMCSKDNIKPDWAFARLRSLAEGAGA